MRTETSAALPPDAVAELIQASTYPQDFRAEMIDLATANIMSRYPWAYREEAIAEEAERANA